jgi:ribA/ribD-fused uncharacterized protein
MTESFTFFWNGPFSQWHPARFSIEGVQYNCAEQYMMAEKARYFRDEAALEAIMAAAHPRQQKRIGRKVAGFAAEEWEHAESNGRPYCWNVVWRGNVAKFAQNDRLREKLMATDGTTLVEASPSDTIWGIGLAEDDPRAGDRSQWLGRNWLGEVLTDVREHLKANG